MAGSGNTKAGSGNTKAGSGNALPAVAFALPDAAFTLPRPAFALPGTAKPTATAAYRAPSSGFRPAALGLRPAACGLRLTASGLRPVILAKPDMRIAVNRAGSRTRSLATTSPSPAIARPATHRADQPPMMGPPWLPSVRAARRRPHSGHCPRHTTRTLPHRASCLHAAKVVSAMKRSRLTTTALPLSNLHPRSSGRC